MLRKNTTNTRHPQTTSTRHIFCSKMLKMSLFRTFEPFGFFWKKVTILKVTILALEISFVIEVVVGETDECCATTWAGFLPVSISGMRNCLLVFVNSVFDRYFVGKGEARVLLLFVVLLRAFRNTSDEDGPRVRKASDDLGRCDWMIDFALPRKRQLFDQTSNVQHLGFHDFWGQSSINCWYHTKPSTRWRAYHSVKHGIRRQECRISSATSVPTFAHRILVFVHVSSGDFIWNCRVLGNLRGDGPIDINNIYIYTLHNIFQEIYLYRCYM